MHVILVEIVVKPEHRDAFKAEALRHATTTKDQEPGCVQFDVSADKTEPGLFYFYEVYADDDALEEHRNSPSLARYRDTSKDWTVSRSVKTALKQS